MNLLERLFSPEKRAARLEKKLQKAVSANNQPGIASAFGKLFRLFLEERSARVLSDLIVTYGPRVEDVAWLKENISSTDVEQAIQFLEQYRFDSAALATCDLFGYDTDALDILAKRGRANDLATRVKRGDIVDKELLQTAVTLWEKHNGDIRKSPTMRDELAKIAKFAPEHIPDQPRVREIVGQFREAAIFYAEAGDLPNAARCYETAEMYGKAYEIYERIGDRESASRAAESLGDLEKALELVVKPERKANLLIRLDRFTQAREFVAGLEAPDPYFALIKARAKERMEVKKKSHDFIGAMELAYIAECEEAEREGILQLGQQYLDARLALATDKQETEALYRDRVRLLEKAGHFEEAGRIAEEVVEDLELASSLYEKANLFNRAIGTASSLLRSAQLHKEGGNLLEAAKLLESAGQYDDAFELYERVQKFNKAIECYLKTSSPSQGILIRLYTSAGEFEKVVEMCIEAGDFSDLEQALSIATTHNLTSHIRVIREKMTEFMRGSEQDLEQCFANARKQVLGAYSTCLGIDFGTTNSVIAIFNKESKKVEIVPNSKGMAYEPSFFGVDANNHPIFGEAARLLSLTAPECVVARVKRSLGERANFSVNGKPYKGEQVVAYLLQHLRSNAEAYLQAKVEAGFYDLVEARNLRFPAQALRAFLDRQDVHRHIESVVLCVPAYFNDDQKRATRDSAVIAGLDLRRLLHEPTAAALAYSYQKPYAGKLAVIDLGGGTLDISIVDIDEGITDVLSVGGDTKLGGSDIDAILVQYAVEHIRQLWGIDIDEKTHPTEMARLRDACENLKINLSSVNQYAIELRHFLNRPAYTLTLTRAGLERLSKPILDRFKATIEETMREYGSAPDDFVLVGHATKMPAVRDLAKKTVRANDLRGIDPGAVVATGAALEGAILTDDLRQILVLDIVPYSLGIAAVKERDTDTEEISRLIEKNARIPTKKSDIYSTRHDNQPNVHIRIFQGESRHPHQNHCLGEFILQGISPAPAGVPKIEVTFDISVDCILTVSAVDQATGNQQSIRVEGAAGLSRQQKGDLRDILEGMEKVYDLEKNLEKLRREIDALKSACDQAMREAERTIQDFFQRFHEKVEVNPKLYKASRDQVTTIQEMFIGKDQFLHGIPKYKDQLASTLYNLAQTEMRHLDYVDPTIVSRLRERIDALSGCRRALGGILTAIENNVIMIVGNWLTVLDGMEPDVENMAPLEMANYHLTAGRANKAREILESLAASPEGLTKEALRLLLKCYVMLGLREEYSDAHRRFGGLFGMVYPDFNRLNAYLKVVDASVFMIQGVSDQRGISGSGFCVAPNLIVTNRHVVEEIPQQQIKIIGKNRTFGVEQKELDPFNDLAVLRISETLEPLKLGEFDFVEPGEQVLAIGFPSPSSSVLSENIYISTGIVNSIRRIDVSPERVIFTDAKIASGMSGGPLINDLGEVVGIVTLVRVEWNPDQKGQVFVQDQPIALPIHLVRKYMMSSHDFCEETD